MFKHHAKSIAFLSAISILSFCSSSLAVIKVRITTIGGTTFTTDHVPGQNISITADNATSQINIWSTTSTETIGSVTIAGSGSNIVKVVIGSGAFGFTSPPGVNAAGDLKGISTFRDKLWLYGRIGGNLTGNIFIGQVWAFTVGGQLVRGITGTEGGPMNIRAGSIAAGPQGNVLAQVGNIGLVDITDNMLGNVIAQNGNINNVMVGGNIGTPANPSDILAATTINNIATTNVYANIDAGTTLAPANIGALTTTGVFSGSLDAAEIENGGLVTIGGDLDGVITLASSLLSSTEIRIGGSMSAGAAINVPSVGLAGQIVVNNNDLGGQWLGAVNVAQRR